MLVAPPLVAPVLGEAWANAGEVIWALSPMLFASAVVGPLSRVIYLANGQALKLGYDVCKTAIVLLTFGFPAGRTFTDTLWIFSLLSTAAYGIYFVLLAGLISRPEHE